MCNKIKCAGQYTVDLINNISRNVQTSCTGYIHSSSMDDSEFIQFIKLSLVDVMRLSLSLGA